MKKWSVICSLVIMLSACSYRADENINPYTSTPYTRDYSKSIAWNFYQEADYYAFYCGLIAESGYEKKPFRSQYAKNLSACVKDAQRAVSKAYEEVTKSQGDSQVKSLSNTYYGEWEKYINELDVNKEAKPLASYTKAINELKAKVQN